MLNTSSPITLEELRQTDDSTLIAFIALKAEEPEIAKIAFQVFYERFRKYLSFICNRNCSRYGSLANDLFEIVFNNSFLKAYDRIEQFNAQGASAPVIIQKRIKLWLTGIAKNELFGELRKINSQPRLSLVEDVSVLEFPSDEEEAPNTECYEMALLNSALQCLNEKERGILLESYQYAEEGKYIPAAVLQGICEFYGITKDSLRQIKRRALIKVQQQIDLLLSQSKDNEVFKRR